MSKDINENIEEASMEDMESIAGGMKHQADIDHFEPKPEVIDNIGKVKGPRMN